MVNGFSEIPMIYSEALCRLGFRGSLSDFSREALNKDLSLFLDSGRIRLCEAPCGADVALFRGFLVFVPLSNVVRLSWSCFLNAEKDSER
jgi:hypothetical protein